MPRYVNSLDATSWGLDSEWNTNTYRGRNSTRGNRAYNTAREPDTQENAAARNEARANQPPEMPQRQWWQYFPFLNQGYEDELASYQNEYDWWMTQNQREYDSYASQMERMNEAGLNPNLMYDQGESFTGGKGQVHKPEDKTSDSMRMVLDGIMNSVAMGAKIKNLNQVNALNKVKAVTEAKKQGLIDRDKAKREVENEFLQSTLDTRVMNEHLKQQLNQEMLGLTKAQKNKVAKEMSMLDQDIEYKKFVNELAETGLTTSDSAYIRFMYIKWKKGDVSIGDIERELNKSVKINLGNNLKGIGSYYKNKK
jgi:hypothetical protein